MNISGPDGERQQPGGDEQVYGLAQLLALSDGVFAVSLTVLVVQLTVHIVPSLAGGCRSDQRSLIWVWIFILARRG